MDNFERGDRAERALLAYRGTKDLNPLGEPFPDGYPISDLIADLCHLLARHGLDVQERVMTGLADFGADVIEQAWEHSEDWASELQDASNLQRALSVMQSAGVPEAAHDEALRRVGLLPPLESEG